MNYVILFYSTYKPNSIPTNSYTPRPWTTKQPLYVIQRVSRVLRTPETPATSRPLLSTLKPLETPADSSRSLPTINPFASRYLQYQVIILTTGNI